MNKEHCFRALSDYMRRYAFLVDKGALTVGSAEKNMNVLIGIAAKQSNCSESHFSRFAIFTEEG